MCSFLFALVLFHSPLLSKVEIVYARSWTKLIYFILNYYGKLRAVCYVRIKFFFPNQIYEFFTAPRLKTVKGKINILREQAKKSKTFPNSFINFIGTGWRHIECKIIYRKICLAACARASLSMEPTRNTYNIFRRRIFFNSFYFICSTRCALIQRSPGFIFMDKTKKDHQFHYLVYLIFLNNFYYYSFEFRNTFSLEKEAINILLKKIKCFLARNILF